MPTPGNDVLSVFVLFLKKLASARKEDSRNHEKVYQSVTDSQTVTAAFLAMRLWKCWQAAEYGEITEAQLYACARQFVREDRPRLQEHLDFIDRHRGALRLLFIELCEQAVVNDDKVLVSFRGIVSQVGGAILFSTYNTMSGLHNLDNTELGYFAALDSPDLCRKIADRTGAAVPSVRLFGLENAMPEPAAMDAMPGDA
ncbi:MAG: hypothetical protein OXC07_13050 [Kistimonas sp.]|nr:hypothetical protein [Kistimonas sp.]